MFHKIHSDSFTPYFCFTAQDICKEMFAIKQTKKKQEQQGNQMWHHNLSVSKSPQDQMSDLHRHLDNLSNKKLL